MTQIETLVTMLAALNGDDAALERLCDQFRGYGANDMATALYRDNFIIARTTRSGQEWKTQLQEEIAKLSHMFNVVASVRKSGAIGIFYTRLFTVQAAPDATRDDILKAWFKANGGEWELGGSFTYSPVTK